MPLNGVNTVNQTIQPHKNTTRPQRTRSISSLVVMPMLLSPMLLSQPCAATVFKQQSQLDHFARQTKVTFAVVSNFQAKEGEFVGQISLSNQGDIALSPGKGNWQIYFHSIRKISAQSAGVRIEHVQGDLHRLVPEAHFAGLKPTEQLSVQFRGAPWMVSYSDFMPRAFISAGSLTPAVFANTDTENFGQFVAPILSNAQQQRYDKPAPDLYPISDAALRFQHNAAALPVDAIRPSLQQSMDRILPTPLQVHYGPGRTELHAQWQIQYQGEFKNEALYLQQQLKTYGLSLGLSLDLSQAPAQARLPSANVDPENLPLQKPTLHKHAPRIVLQRASSPFTLPSELRANIAAADAKTETYQLDISAEQILITATDNAGLFYGLQSLLSLMPAPGSMPQHALSSGQNGAALSVPQLTVLDAPRYHWRGMHYDMSRNFHGLEVTKRLIDQMARMKLNKLHLHLTDDEGWRIEIADLPELTQIGAYRCFDLSEQQCLLTQLGTGPHKSGSGNGFYTRDEFIALLKYAAERHIDVIPEIDMPGHARAAIKAMQARYQRLRKAGNLTEATRYLLSDPQDKSQYLTVQNYTDNSVNVCLDSSYAFIDKVMYELQQMYRSAGLSLTTYHMGGDEVAAGSWQQSPACQQLLAQGQAGVAGVGDLKLYFARRVAELAAKRQLQLGGWEDGLMQDASTPLPRTALAAPAVYANVWDNIWEWGVADRAYRLANAGYQVVLSHGTHLYLDHPHEAHPAERGYYWATRFIDARRIFGYMPDHLYANADKTRRGEVITDLADLLGRPLPALTRPELILGMQGQIWSESIRTAAQLEQMLYPRLWLIAERAWHKAAWESDTPDLKARDAQWWQVAHTLGRKELAKFSAAGITYDLAPPGATLRKTSSTTKSLTDRAPKDTTTKDTATKETTWQLLANHAYGDIAIEYSLDGGQTWLRYPTDTPVDLPADVLAPISALTMAGHPPAAAHATDNTDLGLAEQRQQQWQILLRAVGPSASGQQRIYSRITGLAVAAAN